MLPQEWGGQIWCWHVAVWSRWVLASPSHGKSGSKSVRDYISSQQPHPHCRAGDWVAVVSRGQGQIRDVDNLWEDRPQQPGTQLEQAGTGN